MKIKHIFKDISNNLGRFVQYTNRLGVNDGYPHDINAILKLQEQQWSDIGGSSLKTEDDDYELHHRHIRATANTLEEYFINNGMGFDHPYVMHNINNRNYNIEIYSRNLHLNKLAKIKQDIIRVFKKMDSNGMLGLPHKTETIKLYIFDNKNDYRHYGNKFGLGLGDEGGMHYYIGSYNILSEIYLYQDGDVRNLAHEIVHANVAYITGGKKIPTVISEGIADKIQYHLSNDSNAQGASIDATRKHLIDDYDLSRMLSLEYSNDFVQNSLVYRVGHALTMYFDWQNPKILIDYLRTVRTSTDLRDANKILYKYYDKEAFKTFLVNHSTEAEMKSINALKVECGEKLATVKEIVDNQYQDVTYYEAKINIMNRAEIVGKFSSVIHSATGNTMRVLSADIKSYFDLSQKFNFMKVLKHRGELKLVYCDRYGNEYKDSHEYQNQLDRIKYRYSSDNNIIEKLTYFDLSSVRNIKGKSFLDYFSEGKIFSLKILGMHKAKSMSGISIYSDEIKIGELTGDTTYVKEIGNNKFIMHDDRLMGMFMTFTEAYIAVRQEDQEYKLSFIDGRKIEADKYFDIPHIHLAPLFEPSINNIIPKYLTTELLISNVDILDHADSAISKYSEDHRASKHTIEKGRLLDDKGTEREIDDVYEAEIIHLGNKIDTFRNVGFSISEFGDFFITDYGKGLRYQLPKEINHLKLVTFKDSDGTIINRLVPITQDGNEFPDGMPNIPDEYRLIDPMFAHKYEKEDHSHQHINIGLINFDQYAKNSLFKIKYDPNDYHITRDQQGNILRIDNTTYITKVKIYDESGSKELGMLSNDFHQFKDKIFISFDYNYSYKDFLLSHAPKIEYKILSDGTQIVTFEQSESDISNNNYQDYKRVVVRNDNTGFSKQSDVLIKQEGHDWITSLDHGATHSQNALNIESATRISSDRDNDTGITAINTTVIIATSIGTLSIIAVAGGLLYGGYRLYHYYNDHYSNNLIESDSQATYGAVPNPACQLPGSPYSDFVQSHDEQESLVTLQPVINNTKKIDIVARYNLHKSSSLSQNMTKKYNGKITEDDSSIYDVPSRVSGKTEANSSIYDIPSKVLRTVKPVSCDINDLPPPIPLKFHTINEEVIDLSGELPPPPPDAFF